MSGLAGPFTPTTITCTPRWKDLDRPVAGRQLSKEIISSRRISQASSTRSATQSRGLQGNVLEPTLLAHPPPGVGR